MRHFALALTFASLVLGCSGKKQPAKPTPPPPGDGMAKTGDTGPATKEEPVAPKKEEPPPPPKGPDTGGFKLIPTSAQTFAPLDASKPGGPELAVVSGDPMKSGGGLFLKLPAGFKSGLHTHTADYHAVVVSGAPKHYLVGGDKAAKPLGVGSYWFQPGGQPHGDECTGKDPCVLYIAIMGAFDFTPTPTAKPGKPGKYSLIERKALKFNPMDPKQPKGPKMAVVSGDPKVGPVAIIIEMPPGGNAGLHSHTSEYNAVVLEGGWAHWLPHETNEGEPLTPGAFWFQPGGYDHGDRCTGTTPCRVFVMLPGALDFKPAKGAEKMDKTEKTEKTEKMEKAPKPPAKK
jgi:quercetin dioxygenase-like cupin family protein